MPHADSATTARAWATERLVLVWAAWESEWDGFQLGADDLALVEANGARFAILRIDAPAPPSPAGLFEGMLASGVGDVRRLGVLTSSRRGIEAAKRAGAAAIVGIAADVDARKTLVSAAPDVITAPEAFAALDAERYGSTRPLRERVLLNPGPTVVSDRVHRAIGGPDLCHREPEYNALFARIQEKLRRIAGVGPEWRTLLISGSGTAAMEAMTGGFVRPGRKLLVCRNGIYGDRIATIARRLGIATDSVSASHVTPIDPAEVARALEADPAIDAVAVIHHETTTGLLNPVQEIAEVAARSDALVLVDAISAFGSEPLNLNAGVDALAATSNKNLHGLPGVSILLLSPRARARAAEVEPRLLYFDIPGYLAAEERQSVPFTPAIPATYALEAALDELLDEGPSNRVEKYRERGAFLDQALGRLGLEPIVAAAARSSSVRSLPLPPGIGYDQLHDALKRHGYVIYAGLGEAARTSFRVCTLGNLEIGALEGFVDALDRTLATESRAGRNTAPPGAAEPDTTEEVYSEWRL